MRLAHGTSSSQSRYVRIIWYSGAAGVMRSRRSTSRLATAAMASGRLASVTRLRSSCVSPSPSPSSVWMALSCWRSTYCRCASVISCAARDSICPFSSSTSISRASAEATASSLTEMLFSSSSRCLSSGFMHAAIAGPIAVTAFSLLMIKRVGIEERALEGAQR